jgi:hypothetical protein
MTVTTRRAARAKLRRLGISIPSPFSVDALCSHVSERRGRPIRLLELDLSQALAPCGLWIATATTDYVCVDQAASALLRQHIILHELSHILCGHRGVLGPDHARQFTILDPAVVRRVLERRAYDDAEEREAELLASEIGSRVDRDDGEATADADTRQVLDRLSAVLGDRPRR